MSVTAIYRQLGRRCWEGWALATVNRVGVESSTNVHLAEKHRTINRGVKRAECSVRVNPTGVLWVAVAKPFILPTKARKRGNPNWGKPIERVPAVPTAFEELVKKLGLDEQTCATSEKLKQWCERNKDHCYVPEWLLKQWGMSVDPNVSG